MDIIDAREKRPGVRVLGYDPDLLISFPLRLSRADRELFFQRNKMTLLPQDKWHDEAALKRMMLTKDYLFWLSDGVWSPEGKYVYQVRTPAALYGRLGTAIKMFNGRDEEIKRAQAEGFNVKYGNGPRYTEGEWSPYWSPSE
ncbi:hypothetical protein D9M70_593270 [compost metagenome]